MPSVTALRRTLVEGAGKEGQRERLLRLCVTQLRADGASCRATVWPWLLPCTRTTKALPPRQRKLLVLGLALCVQSAGAPLRPPLHSAVSHAVLRDVFKKLLASRDACAAECALALLRAACSGEPGAAPAARKLFRAHPRLAAAMVQPAFAALHSARADRSSTTGATRGTLTSLVCDIIAAGVSVALPASDPAPLVAFLSRVEPPSAASLGALEALSAEDARCDCIAIARHLARMLKREALSKALRSKTLRVLVAVLEDVDRPLPAELGRELGAAVAELLDSDAGSVLVAGNTAALATLVSMPGVVALAQLLRRLDSKLELGSRNAPLTVGRLARDALWRGLCAPTAGATAAAAAATTAAPARIVAVRLCALLRSAEDLDAHDAPRCGFAPSVLRSVFAPAVVDAVQEHGSCALGVGSGASGPLRSIATLFSSSGGSPPVAAAALASELVQLADADHDDCTALKLLTVALPCAPESLRAVELRAWLAQRCDALVRAPTAAAQPPLVPHHALELLLQLAQFATMAAAGTAPHARRPFRDWLDRHAVELLLRPGIDDCAAAALCAMLVRGGPARTRTLFGALAALSSNTADSVKLLRFIQLLGHVAAASRGFITADEAQRAQRSASDTAHPGADEYQGFETKQERMRQRSSLRLARCVRTSFISPYIPLIIRLALGSEDIAAPPAAAAVEEFAPLAPTPVVVPAALRCAALHTLAALMLMSPELVATSAPRILALTECSGGASSADSPPQSTSPQATAAHDDVAVSAVFLCGAILRADAERESQRAAVEALAARLSDGSAPVCCAALAVLGNLLVSKQVQPAAVLPRIAAATVHASVGALATAFIRQLLRREGKLASRLLFDIYCGLASIDSGTVSADSAGTQAGGSRTTHREGVDTLAVMTHIIAVAKAAHVDARDLALPLLHTLIDESGMGCSVRARKGRLLSASPLARSAAATLRLLPPSQSAATWKALSSLTNVWRTGTGGLQGIGVAVERGVAGDISAYCRAASARATAEKRDAILRALTMLPVA